MNLTININWYKLLFYTACIVLSSFTSCKKIEEPMPPLGGELPYVNTKKKLAAIIDSIPDATMFKAAFKRSTLQNYMDSLTAGNDAIPYTYFIPVDQTFINAGYTANRLNTMPVNELNDLLGYLIIPGYINNANEIPERGVTYTPLVHPDPYLERTMPFVFFEGYPYAYTITVGFTGKTLLLNSKKVKENAVGIRGSNGAVFMIDDIVTKPVDELYQVLDADTSLTFYMAASRKSQEIYTLKGILGYNGYNFRFNTTDWMMLNNNYNDGGGRALPFAIVFAPVNDAFRKAGFHSVSDVEAYIDKSELLKQPDYTEMFTNIDSILINHRILSGFSNVNNNWSYLYTPDLLNLTSLSNNENAGAIKLQDDNGTIVIHRQDFPNGRAAKIIPAYDIITLNGVVHHVDNLMLPTP